MIGDTATRVNAPTPSMPNGQPFGSVTIGTTSITLLVADRTPTNRGYFLHDDVPAVEFGPAPDPATVANAIAAMVMLLGLRPAAAG